MLIKIQETSDPNVRNFYPAAKVLSKGCTEYADAKSLRKSPLAEAVFDVGGIENVLLTPDMVSVTKNNAAEWEEIAPQVMAEIMDFCVTGEQAVVNQIEPKSGLNETLDAQELMKKILGLVAARIRPALNKDGGDIEIKSFENGILWVELTGKCAGCPYAVRTLKDGVERILKDYIPEIVAVKPVVKEKK